ncbi:MAG TPA: Sir2 family NAD-dependent protein deacetylase [Stellaceae bacterium]|nr:Sir2 family NAD-dependent protein deacetylase [Stellaceae bacterium]
MRFSSLPKIVVMTGGAVSRASGFAPFDAATMPAGLRLEDVLTPDGFARDPARVRAFYNLRRRELLAAQPNPAHEALAVLDAVRQREVLIVTRNIDDFHERAGSQTVIHTHGELLKARCMICTRITERYDDIVEATACPDCGNSGHLRPHVVWVGEEPLRMATVYEALTHATLLLVAGLPAHAEPIRGIIADARRAGASVVGFLAESGDDHAQDTGFDERQLGPIAETMPAFVKKLIGG